MATDLDGTLVRSDGSVSDRTRHALGLVEAAGATLVFVTGRPPRWMHPIVEATGHRGVAICANGAVLYDLRTEEVVYADLLDPAVAAALVRALRSALPEVSFAVERGRAGFAREPTYRTRWPGRSDVLVTEIGEMVSEPVVKLLARHEGLDADALLARAREVVGDLAELTHSSREGLLEISGAGVSKASALARLAADTGVGARGVLAFGDMPNDLPMLAWAGHSVAVRNAHPDVLAVVDEVTASNDDDGVAFVLERVYGGNDATDR